MDECQSSQCGRPHKCINRPGYYQCVCAKGYKRSGRNCVGKLIHYLYWQMIVLECLYMHVNNHAVIIKRSINQFIVSFIEVLRGKRKKILKDFINLQVKRPKRVSLDLINIFFKHLADVDECKSSPCRGFIISIYCFNRPGYYSCCPRRRLC